MFSFLGELFGLLLRCLIGCSRQIADEFDRTLDGFQQFVRNWLNTSLDSTQQTIASRQWSIGPPGGLIVIRAIALAADSPGSRACSCAPFDPLNFAKHSQTL